MNPRKLLLSKWTAVAPKNKEKHFLVSKLIENEQGDVIACILEAVYSHNEYTLQPQDLKNSAQWMIGWK